MSSSQDVNGRIIAGWPDSYQIFDRFRQDFAHTGLLSAYVSYVRDVLIIFFPSSSIPSLFSARRPFLPDFLSRILSCLSYLRPSLYSTFFVVRQVSMVSALWKACSEGDLTNIHEFLKGASAVDFEIKGTNQLTWLYNI